ncbi:hypothetical protein IWW45_000865 [Coemansia sp. RSA 485]|nr:hypothetical protein IWW45_000865 [Coemansia sp. RSA 485]
MASSELDIKRLEKTCRKIVNEGDLDKLTARSIRRTAEERMGLEEQRLDQVPYKQMVKDIVAKALEDLNNSKSDEESVPESAAESEEKSEDETQAHAQEDSDSDAGEHESADGKESDVGENDEEGSKKRKDRERNGKSDSEEDFSDVNDSEPAKTKAITKPKKRASEAALPAKAKRTKTTPIPTPISKSNEVTIGNLKTYVNKCGMRKVWSKELNGMNAAQQIRHLKKLLGDLGMDGRPTLEKCKKIKAKRDLQAELEAIEGDAIIDDVGQLSSEPSRRRRSTTTKRASYRLDISSEEEDEASEEDDKSSEESNVGDEGKGKGKDGDESDGDGDGDGDGSDKSASDNEEQANEETEETEETEESDAYTEGDGESDGGDRENDEAAHSADESGMASSAEDSE